VVNDKLGQTSACYTRNSIYQGNNCKNKFTVNLYSINTFFKVYYNKEVIYLGRKTGKSKNINLTDFSHLITKVEEISENKIDEGKVKEE
jgi:benzoyl-CoA reductase/2-hydroxyglutaryl-CoA dehydratase subunit BcrC/BadD/HgdB